MQIYENFSLNIRNKTRMSPITTFIQHCAEEVVSTINMIRKGKIKHYVQITIVYEENF